MKNLKKILFIISCISACISLFFIVETYSRYVSSATGTANLAIARWNITVNNLTVKNNSDLSNVITPIFPGTTHIAEGIIAPTAEGYFDLELDYTNVDVSFDYEIEISPNANSSVQDLIATGYSINNGTIINITDNANLNGTVLKDDTTRTQSIRVYIKWDDTNGTMDNIADTAATIPDNASALLDVKISFIQKAN